MYLKLHKSLTLINGMHLNLIPIDTKYIFPKKCTVRVDNVFIQFNNSTQDITCFPIKNEQNKIVKKEENRCLGVVGQYTTELSFNTNLFIKLELLFTL